MSGMLLEFLVIGLLVLANGVFAMAELAIVSARKSRLRQEADRGDEGARVALQLAEDPNRLLSTVQIGITVVGTLAGVFGGATLAEHLAEQLVRVPALAPYAGGISLGVVVAAISYLSLIFGELVPKRLALGRPERIAAAVSRPLRALSTAGVPLVRLLSFSTELVLRVFGKGGGGAEPVTEEEIKGLVSEGAAAGVFEPAEREMLHRVFRFGDAPVRLLMTQRADVVWIDAGEAPDAMRRKVAESPHSRFPVCDGQLDVVIGVVLAKDLLARDWSEGAIDLRGILRMPVFVFDTMTGPRALEAFKASKASMAVVLDEYGAVQGLLTLTDILESLVGVLPAEGDEAAPVARREDGSWLADGALSLAELQDLVPLPAIPEGDYETLAGFILDRLGRIPSAADHFEWCGFRFEVADMDGKRIDRVLITEVGPGPGAEPGAG